MRQFSLASAPKDLDLHASSHHHKQRDRGIPLPRAFFPFATDLDLTDLHDYLPMPHPAFALTTVHSHTPVPGRAFTSSTEVGKSGGNSRREDAGDAATHEGYPLSPEGFPTPSLSQQRDQHQLPKINHPGDTHADSGIRANLRPMFDLSIYERPNMLSLNGREPGTFGFCAFIERDVADGLMRDDPTGSHSSEHSSTSAAAALKDIGVRDIPMRAIAERLEKASLLRDEIISHGRPSYTAIQSPVYGGLKEMGRWLFEDLLLESARRSSGTEQDMTGRDGTQSSDWSLKKQIKALLKVLGKENTFWKDFSLPRERLAFVLALNLPTSGDEPGISKYADDRSKTDKKASREPQHERRYYALLHLLISVELVLRMDAALRLGVAVHGSLIDGVEEVTSEDIHRFNKLRTRKVDWDMVGAKRFLGLCSAKAIPETPSDGSGEPNSGHAEHPTYDCAILPRKLDIMVDGLIHFAQGIGWNDAAVAQMKERLTQTFRGKTSDEIQKVFTQRYQCDIKHLPRHTCDIASTMPLLPPVNDFIGGPATHAWLTGLIVPGFHNNDLLISALLENDTHQEPLKRLGTVAYPRTGFVFGSCSWWSKLCVVAGVLAPVPDTKEVMGWVKLPAAVTPLDAETGENVGEGWRNVTAKPMSVESGKERIFDGEAIAKDSATLGVGKGAVKGSEFEMLTDDVFDSGGSHRETIKIEEVELALQRVMEDVPIPYATANASSGKDENSLPREQACVLVSISQGESAKTQTAMFELKHTVRFIAQHPCRPPRGQTTVHHKLSADSQSSTHTGAAPTPSSSTKPGDIERHMPAHPLHKSYKYKVQSLASFLSTEEDEGVEEQSNTSQSSAVDTRARHDKILIVDARGPWQNEVLARAVCAKVGRHAIISRAAGPDGKRAAGCLSCPVREARALGVDVVLRVG